MTNINAGGHVEKMCLNTALETHAWLGRLNEGTSSPSPDPQFLASLNSFCPHTEGYVVRMLPASHMQKADSRIFKVNYELTSSSSMNN